MNKPVIELKRDANGHFRPGNPPGPGRPRGSKNRFGESFMRDLNRLWQQEGEACIRRAMRQSPASFIRSMVISHKPTLRDPEMAETSDFQDLQSPDEVIAAVEEEFGPEVAAALAKQIGQPMKLIAEGRTGQNDRS